MTPDRLLAQFERISDAPNAVTKLRELVLQLAAVGKLCPQIPTEQTASLLLEEISASMNGSKPRLRRWKGRSEVKSLCSEVPSGWATTALGEIADVNWGNTSLTKKSYTESGFTAYSAAGPDGYIEHAEFSGPGIVLSAIGARSGRCFFAVGQWTAIKNTITIVPHEPISNEWLFIILNRESIWCKRGGAQPFIALSDAIALPILLPSRAEQLRIVAKVDELMGLCDQLEAAQVERERRRDRLAAASLARLNQPGDASYGEEFRNHVRFHLDHLPRVTTRPEQIPAIRQTILSLAVRGLLIPQDPSDEPATMLLKRSKVTVAQLADQKKIRKPNSLPALEPSDTPYELPEGWAWARFTELGEFCRGKSRHRPRNDSRLYSDGTYKLVQTGDIARANGIVETHTGLYNDFGLAQSRIWPKGTMCITIAANIADSAILGFDACIPDSVVGFVPVQEIRDARYFEFFMRTAKANLEDFAPSTAQKNINIGILETVLVPLPPLFEMQRIVAKVDELMAICDELESQLATAETNRRRLLEAVLVEALNTAPSEQVASLTNE